MSPHKTKQSEHESHDHFNDSNAKADFNDSNGDDDDEDEGHYADPDRILFMESLVPVENSFALVYKKSNGKATLLMYEGLSDGENSDHDLTDSEDCVCDTRKILQGFNSLSENVGPSDLDNTRQNDQDHNGPSVIKKVGNDDRCTEKDQDHNGQTRKVGSSNGRGLSKKRKNDQGKGAERESSSIVEAQVNQCNSSEQESSGIIEAQGNRGNGAEKTRISVKIEAPDDQDYGDFNRSNGIWLNKYSEKECDIEDGNVETCSNSGVEVLDKDPHCSELVHTPFADSKVIDDSGDDDDVQYIGELRKPENLQFRKDVEDILKRPYDKKEYDTLWLQVKARKLQEGHRELRRGRAITYVKDTMGKSYLDEYIDLEKVLDTFRTDLPRKLNVLRGFFFYLKKMATEGIFKPWLDESCLAIVPGTQ